MGRSSQVHVVVSVIDWQGPTALKQLPEDKKKDYAAAKVALIERFEPPSKKDLYAAEFYVRRKCAGESWGDLADELKMLVRFLTSLTNYSTLSERNVAYTIMPKGSGQPEHGPSTPKSGTV